jgi:hypothetical protein
MPLTELQKKVLSLLANNRTEESYLAGAAGVHMSKTSPRRSADLDLFHDREEAVASAFAEDRAQLEEAGYHLSLQLSQPGFIRAMVSDVEGEEQVRIDWAYDSAWRFMPPVRIEEAGYVLHPADLAVNKVLALVGREEPRDFIDIVYLHQRVLPLGALAWAACGKDPGFNPEMLLDLLGRRGRVRQEELDRLDLALPLDAVEQERVYLQALEEGRSWIESRPAEEAGCFYRNPDSGLFFAPAPGEPYEVHVGGPGGVLPVKYREHSYLEDEAERRQLESFFERRLQLKDSEEQGTMNEER